MDLKCLDAMRCSSPPHSSSTEDYGSLKPSAMNYFEKIRKQAKDKKIVLFLDYDGTLSPIVEKPELAVMSTEMHSVVQIVANLFTTAIVSGRSCDKVIEFVKVKELYYAGSHGMDIVGPTHKQGTSVSEEKLFQPDAASDLIRQIDHMVNLFKAGTGHIQGVEVENNKFCLSVHYRNAADKKLEVARIVEKILKDYPHFHKTDGLMVFEIRPTIRWNKGDAVEFLLKTLRLDNAARVLPIYIGDDRTDEDAFKYFKNILGYGIGILVSSTPKPTEAEYSLKDPDDVMLFLKCLARWKGVV